MSEFETEPAASEELVAAPPMHDSDSKVETAESAVPPMYNAGEQELVAEVRHLLDEAGETYDFSDMTILRFIRGRKGDVERAFRLLQRHIAWRAEKNVDNLGPESCQEELDKRKSMISGIDPHQRPALFVFAVRHNKYDRDMNQLENLIIYSLEKALKMSVPNEQRIIVIFDLSGFSMQCMDYEAVRLLVDILQTQYPEILGVAYVVNAPWVFNACWSIIKLWLDPVTTEKVSFVDEAHIREMMRDSEIPEYLGLTAVE